MRAMVLLLLLVACVSAQPSGIEGTAINSVGGQPLAGVHIQLISGVFDSVKDVYGAISDKAGHFSISPMNPGNYMLNVSYPGFLYVPPKAATSILPALQLKAAQKLSDYKIELTPRAELAGRVLDEFGDPVPDVNVSVLSASPGEESRRFLNGAFASSSTDDRGEFHLGVLPGKYYLMATPHAASDDPAEVRTDGTSEITYGPTFFPSSATQGNAVAVEAVAAKETGALDIRLLRMRTYRISGIVTGLPGGAGTAQIILWHGESAQRLNDSRGAMTDSGGRFTFSKLAPGYYRLSAQFNSGKTQLQSDSVDVQLDADPPPVQLSLSPGAELSGTLQAKGFPGQKRSVRLQLADRGSYGSSALTGGVDADGTFQISNVPRGRYHVIVDPLPEDAYLKTVQLDGADAPNGILDLSRGAQGSKVRLVATAGAAQFSGRVVDKSGEPFANAFVLVLLLSDPKTAGDEDAIRISSDGSFSKKGIRPGKYRVLAVNLLQLAGKNGDFTSFFDKAQEVEFKEGDKIVKDLPILESEAAGGNKR